MLKTGYVMGVSRGHNSGVCLLHNGNIVFSIEEERLSRTKYDGSPLAAMNLVKQYTDKVDFIVIVHTASIEDTAPKVEYTGDDIYTGLARKMGLIDRNPKVASHPQVIDYSLLHHKTHAACAFYRSGWEDAVAVVIDGAGSVLPLVVDDKIIPFWEVESIFECSYPSTFKTIYKHYATKESVCGGYTQLSSEKFEEPGSTHHAMITDTCGITKVYEAVTEYCGFQGIEAGKTMGLFPYGIENETLPEFFIKQGDSRLANRHLFIPNYPNGAFVNQGMYSDLKEFKSGVAVVDHQNRRDMAYKCQQETQQLALELIIKACEMTGKNKVVLSGGYGLNCVANYFYLTELDKKGIELYVEPISNDGGTALGAALLHWHRVSGSAKPYTSDIYLGPEYEYTESYVRDIVENAYADMQVVSADYSEVVRLLREKNIVCWYQGRSENGPRALGNRSILFDPTFEDGKDFVNNIKKREYFRPFAGSILEEDVHEWFDLRGMKNSPHMMYAVNCQPGIEEKIPSIIHVDSTCRIQTVSRKDNPNYYDLITEFKNQTGVPIVFNTSFNLGGDPLVETLVDALDTLKKSKLNYLYLPELGVLIKK